MDYTSYIVFGLGVLVSAAGSAFTVYITMTKKVTILEEKVESNTLNDAKAVEDVKEELDLLHRKIYKLGEKSDEKDRELREKFSQLAQGVKKIEGKLNID